VAAAAIEDATHRSALKALKPGQVYDKYMIKADLAIWGKGGADM
jgi:hypothetical protein